MRLDQRYRFPEKQKNKNQNIWQFWLSFFWVELQRDRSVSMFWDSDFSLSAKSSGLTYVEDQFCNMFPMEAFHVISI